MISPHKSLKIPYHTNGPIPVAPHNCAIVSLGIYYWCEGGLKKKRQIKVVWLFGEKERKKKGRSEGREIGTSGKGQNEIPPSSSCRFPLVPYIP